MRHFWILWCTKVLTFYIQFWHNSSQRRHSRFVGLVIRNISSRTLLMISVLYLLPSLSHTKWFGLVPPMVVVNLHYLLSTIFGVWQKSDVVKLKFVGTKVQQWTLQQDVFFYVSLAAGLITNEEITLSTKDRSAITNKTQKQVFGFEYIILFTQWFGDNVSVNCTAPSCVSLTPLSSNSAGDVTHEETSFVLTPVRRWAGLDRCPDDTAVGVWSLQTPLSAQ